MHKNTFILVLILAVVAALLIGVNIGRKFSPNTVDGSITPSPFPSITAVPTTFTSSLCGIKFFLPPGTTIQKEATNAAQFVSTDSSTILFACAKEIPRIPLPPAQIETLTVASISAKLYHTTSLTNETPYDALIFTSPTTTMDVYFAGLGSAFSAIIRSIELLK